MSQKQSPAAGRILPAPENHVTPAEYAQALASRRGFMRQAAGAAGGALAAAIGGTAMAQTTQSKPPAKAEASRLPSWTRTLGPGVAVTGYGLPSKYEGAVQRRQSPGLTRTPQSSVSFTPLQNLFGIVTPSGVHFERHHSGIAEINPSQHRLMIHGLVRRPLILSMDDIMRFPSVSRFHFIECGANSGMEWGNIAVPTVQRIHRRAVVDAARGSRLRQSARKVHPR
jgi:sulfane dehydrogenase subunit SoxC